jgi:AraC family transcriptional regulator
MSVTSHLLASGPGWRVTDIVCTAGPHDRPFEERHEAVCIAAVTRGTFRYRSSDGEAILAPGALLLGNEGTWFECGHEHGVGDRCVAFHFSREHLETVLAAVPGVRCETFASPRLPPLPALAPLLAAVETAQSEGDQAAIEELALHIAGAVAAALAGADSAAAAPSPRDARRIGEALRRIEARADERLTLSDLARDAAMSPYHFLRVFRSVAGMTPHQYVLRTRLHRAAVRLARTDHAISAIAFEAGFEDLSTFNRRFRRVMGAAPNAYRARRRTAVASRRAPSR